MPRNRRPGRPTLSTLACRCALLVGVFTMPGAALALDPDEIVPAVKQWRPAPGTLDLSACRIVSCAPQIAAEAEILGEVLRARSVHVGTSGAPIHLRLGKLELPPIASRYAPDIRDQAYRLNIDTAGVTIEGPTPSGVFYGVQTLAQLVGAARTVPQGQVLDWPDLATRAIMVDPARANENPDYYRRLVQFCGRYKLNQLHLHLTDDQGLALHHDRYAPLLHAHAWRPDALRQLVAQARRMHITLLPEIESLGHARVFLKHPNFPDFLHQTESDHPPEHWVGTNQPGFTNVLCPASPRAREYLVDMYAQAADVFPHPVIHLGCDEVDMTTCSRCLAAFPGMSPAAWFRHHLEQCRKLAAQQGRRVAVWGDMLLKQPEILDGLAREDYLIYDWHYRPEVAADSMVFFQQQGFEVIGCPSLVCAPRMILPNAANFANIQRFAELARTHDLRGLDTTIWIPPRYLSDALWPGIAFAAAQSWSGSRWNEAAFHRGFVRDFFGTARGDAFAAAWRKVAAVDWDLDRFKLACWMDAESLAEARRRLTGDLRAEAERYLADLRAAADELARMRATVTGNHVAWDALTHSVNILACVLEHFLAAADLGRDAAQDVAIYRRLDRSCVAALGWIEADWDRNRFADDPGKADVNRTGQHLLDRFRRMHEFLGERLAELGAK